MTIEEKIQQEAERRFPIIQEETSNLIWASEYQYAKQKGFIEGCFWLISQPEVKIVSAENEVKTTTK